MYCRAYAGLPSINYLLTLGELPVPLILPRLTSINRLKSAIRSPKTSLSNCSLFTSWLPCATASSDPLCAISLRPLRRLCVQFHDLSRLQDEMETFQKRLPLCKWRTL